MFQLQLAIHLLKITPYPDKLSLFIEDLSSYHSSLPGSTEQRHFRKLRVACWKQASPQAAEMGAATHLHDNLRGSKVKASNHEEIAFSPWVTFSSGNDVAINFRLVVVSVNFLHGEEGRDAICFFPIGSGLCSVLVSHFLSLIESGRQDFLLDSPRFLVVRSSASKQLPSYFKVCSKPLRIPVSLLKWRFKDKKVQNKLKL